MSETRIYVLTTGKVATRMIEEIEVERVPLRVGQAISDDIASVIDRAVELAAERRVEIDVRAHGQFWSPSYTCHPDGRVYFHAAGRKAGWIRTPA